MLSEAFASPDSDSDDTRSNKPIPQSLPEGAAEDIREDHVEISTIRVSVFPSEADISKVSPFPADGAVTHHHTESTLQSVPANPHREVIANRDRIAATPSRRTDNWRNVVLAVLCVAVVTQAALMAYWMLSRGGFAALGAQTGSITVTSEPTGSPVAIDGAVRGQTPLTIALDAGAHTVVVGSGEHARSQSLTVTRGGGASMHVQLPVTNPAPAVVAKTALQITTDPSGARVWIDGESRGAAPLTISNLKPGDHAVIVRGGSGQAINRTVTIQPGETASLVLTLPRSGATFASGYLSIQSSLALQVIENGALLGTTDMPRIMLTAGEHELELVNTALGFRTSRTVTITAGQTASFTVVPPRGMLSINALPWAEVWIDGVRVGETPIGNYSLPIGNHELLFRHPDLGEQRKTVAVNAQGPVRVGIDMKTP